MITTVLAVLTGALAATGVVLLIAGFNRPPAQPTSSSTGMWTRHVDSRLRQRLSRRWWQLGLATLAGVVAATVTGWPTLVIVVPVMAFALPMLLSAPPNPDLALLEALDRWVRTVASLLPTGRSIADAIRSSVRQAPSVLSEQLRRLTARLDDRWTMQQGLRAMADELNSADADTVLAALALAAQRGGTGASATLTALAENIQDRLRALREIETERAKPRIVVRQVTVVTVVVLGLAFVFGREFFAPYGSPTGQLLLACLVGAYLGSLVMLRRMTAPRPRHRILTTAQEPVGSP